EWLAITGHLTAAAEIANEIPGQGTLVRPTRFWVRRPECQVHRAEHLLVVQRRQGRALNVRVRANAELTKELRTGIRCKLRIERFLALCGDGVHHFAALKREFHVAYDGARYAARNIETNHPIGAVLDR